MRTSKSPPELDMIAIRSISALQRQSGEAVESASTTRSNFDMTPPVRRLYVNINAFFKEPLPRSGKYPTLARIERYQHDCTANSCLHYKSFGRGCDVRHGQRWWIGNRNNEGRKRHENHGDCGSPWLAALDQHARCEPSRLQLCFDFYMIEAKLENLVGDRTYDSDPLDEELRNDGIEMIAPHRSNRRKPATQDRRGATHSPSAG